MYSVWVQPNPGTQLNSVPYNIIVHSQNRAQTQTIDSLMRTRHGNDVVLSWTPALEVLVTEYEGFGESAAQVTRVHEGEIVKRIWVERAREEMQRSQRAMERLNTIVWEHAEERESMQRERIMRENLERNEREARERDARDPETMHLERIFRESVERDEQEEVDRCFDDYSDDLIYSDGEVVGTRDSMPDSD